MRWDEFERAQPKLAELGRRRLLEPGVVLVATIRADGTPRLSPVEPYVLDGDLWLSLMNGSTKARDLGRDPRLLVHSVITNRNGREGEFKVRGTACAEHDPDVAGRYAAAVGADLGWEPLVGRFYLFAVDIADVAFLRYDDATGDQFVTRWPVGGEFVRRGTTPTEVGEPEARHELLMD